MPDNISVPTTQCEWRVVGSSRVRARGRRCVPSRVTWRGVGLMRQITGPLWADAGVEHTQAVPDPRCGVCLALALAMKTILVVDDSSTILKSMRLKLERAGYAVVTACGGDGALAIMAARPPDLVITDLNMPGMSGIELIREIRLNPAHAQIPLVVLTTEIDTKLKERAKAAGATGWLTKAMDAAKLQAAIAQLLAGT